MGKYNPNIKSLEARKDIKKEEKKIKEARKKILSIADTEYEIDLKSDVEDIKRAKNNVKKEEAIERAKRRRSTRKENRKRMTDIQRERMSYNKGGQGYAAREDESLGMRTGAERTKSQSMRDRRVESYGAFGKRPNQKINRKDGGVAKNYAHGGVDIEFRDEEGSRLSISMERQEDAGYSPSEADFDKQHSLAEEGIMEVGADVKIIQGYNSRASLGETEGVRGTGAMVKGTKFRGSF